MMYPPMAPPSAPPPYDMTVAPPPYAMYGSKDFEPPPPPEYSTVTTHNHMAFAPGSKQGDYSDNLPPPAD